MERADEVRISLTFLVEDLESMREAFEVLGLVGPADRIATLVRAGRELQTMMEGKGVRKPRLAIDNTHLTG